MNTKEIDSPPHKDSPEAFPPAPLLTPGVIAKDAGIPYNSLYLRKTAVKANGKRDPNMIKDSLFIIKRGDTFNIISENYSFKTEAYYSILRHEMEGKTVRPSSSAVLDAYVVPICLERAKLAGIPVCNWGISQGYTPVPAIIYGLNYFATASDFVIVRDSDEAKDAIKHITNIGKYPFCYQTLDNGATVHSCIGIFGKTARQCNAVSHLAEKVYSHFSIPLVTMVYVKTGDQYRLSSLAPVKYSQLCSEERTLLAAYLSHQEFL
jgi:hypothetical protein